MIHDDDPIPRMQSGPIHLVDDDEDRRITKLEETIASVQKKGWALLLAFVAGLGGLGVYVLKQAHDGGALEQKIIDLERAVDRLSDDIKEIRTELIRRSAIDPPRRPTPTSDIFKFPDVLTFTKGTRP